MSASHRLLRQPLVHGTVHGYCRHGCRCDPCKAAKALRAQTDRRRDRKAALEREAASRARNRPAAMARRHADPDKGLRYVHRRRARLIGNGGSHTFAEWREKCALLGNVCIYCGEAKPLTRDHKTPLVRGGTDNIDNIVPACMSCNMRKGTRTAPEFLGLVA